MCTDLIHSLPWLILLSTCVSLCKYSVGVCVCIGFQDVHVWFTIVYQTHVLSRPHTSCDHTPYHLLPTVGFPNPTSHPASGVDPGEGVPRPQGWGDVGGTLQLWYTRDREHICGYDFIPVALPLSPPPSPLPSL